MKARQEEMKHEIKAREIRLAKEGENERKFSQEEFKNGKNPTKMN